MLFYKILLFIGIVLGALGQLALKKSTKEAYELRRGKIFKTLWKMYFNFYFIIGAFGYALSMVVFIMVLSHLDLSLIYPIISINFVFVAILSKWIFKERISKKRWFGMFVITLGVVLTTLS